MNVEIKSYGKVLTPTDSANVLCNGAASGRLVTIPLAGNEAEWSEMTEAAAQALIDANAEPEEPMTETEEKAKAYDIIMGVTGNE